MPQRSEPPRLRCGEGLRPKRCPLRERTDAPARGVAQAWCRTSGTPACGGFQLLGFSAPEAPRLSQDDAHCLPRQPAAWRGCAGVLAYVARARPGAHGRPAVPYRRHRLTASGPDRWRLRQAAGRGNETYRQPAECGTIRQAQCPRRLRAVEEHGFAGNEPRNTGKEHRRLLPGSARRLLRRRAARRPGTCRPARPGATGRH